MPTDLIVFRSNHPTVVTPWDDYLEARKNFTADIGTAYNAIAALYPEAGK